MKGHRDAIRRVTRDHPGMTAALEKRVADEPTGGLQPLAAVRPDEWLDLVHEQGTPEGSSITPAAYADLLATGFQELARIDEILGGADPAQREALQFLRETIAAAAPDAVETISYAMPAFRYRGRALVAYSPFRTHCSLFPMGSQLIEANPERFAPFVQAKGTLHFTPEHPIPAETVRWLVRERMRMIDEALARPARKSTGRAS